MAIASAIFLVLSLVLAVLFGTQTSPWTWGPAMASLLVAGTSAVVVLMRQPTRSLNPAMLVMGVLVVAWFGLRALLSPVHEYGQADLLLLGAALGGFFSVLAIERSERAVWTLTWGIAGLLLASLIVMVIQVNHPGYRPLLTNSRGSEVPTGFFTHYNYAANYLLVSSVWLLAMAWMGSKQRILQITLAILGTLGLASIWWTNSRGGLLAGLIALSCFALVILIDGKRRKAKWFPLAAIALPFMALTLMGMLIYGWQEFQAKRSHDGQGDISILLDNSVRLNYLGLAVSGIAEHPMTGGGSQSFSWEGYQHWDPESLGHHSTKPEFVHNEWLQAAHDYGLIGFLLVLSLLGTFLICAVLRMGFEPVKKDSGPSLRTALRLAGVAGLAAILCQSNFSFILHLAPGALLLGMCLAASCQWRASGTLSHAQKWLQRGSFGSLGVAALILLTPLSWKGSQVMAAMWPSHYSKHLDARKSESLQALDRAIEIWPQASLHMDRGLEYHKLMLASEDPATQDLLADKALADYRSALELHPYLPEAAINLANLLSLLGEDAKAEEAYLKAIELQGGMEPTFRSHYFYAIHLYGMGLDSLREGQVETAVDQLQRASAEIELTPLWSGEDRALQISILESLGSAHEIAGNTKEALAAYTEAATMHWGDGRRVHLRAALVLAAKANEARLDGDTTTALQLFTQARQRVNQAGGQLPPDISPERRADFTRRLDAMIRRLQE
ncbi:MAG: O-antigen ligase family protein [Akkermansiaceae bacterium]|nr:O-antigen ligase family protein [Akkermansiaceae bacterium]